MPDRPKRARERSADTVPSKLCAACGRTIAWRKRWARDWESVRYCSDACRGARGALRPGGEGEALERTILELLTARGRDKTICPSEAARAVAKSDARDAWEPLMEPARQAARRLVGAGRIEITQGGQVVDPSTAKGAIRLRLMGSAEE